MFNVSKKEFIREVLMSSLAALVMALNLNSFVAAGNLVPGGFSGLALLLSRVSEKYFSFNLSYSVLYVLMNAPAALLVYRTISKRFTIISFIDVFLTSLFVSLLPKFTITNDMLLIAVFGGIIGGISNTLVIEANGCSGGLDFISMYFSKKKGKSLWNQVFLVNCCILCVSGMLFGWEAALYSIIYQFVNTQVINLRDTRFKRTYLFVITERAEPLISAIALHFHHSVTIMDGMGGYTHAPKKVLYTVCGDYETDALCKLIQSIDPKAFINVSQSQKIIGNFHEKPF